MAWLRDHRPSIRGESVFRELLGQGLRIS
jgi:hypothetical protein